MQYLLIEYMSLIKKLIITQIENVDTTIAELLVLNS